MTGLTAGTAYSFKVRAYFGTGDTRVNGVESDASSVTPLGDLVPTLATVADQTYTQGVAVSILQLPEAIGGDEDGCCHPYYTYTLSPAAPGGLVFEALDRYLWGTPTSPKAKTSYTYMATEKNDSDGDTESGSKTFTIGVAPKKPASFSATAGTTEATLSWTAIAGVSGWEVKQDSRSWTAISGSSVTTASHTVTGLTNGTAYMFKVRAVVGSDNTLVNGVESDAATATPN